MVLACRRDSKESDATSQMGSRGRACDVHRLPRKDQHETRRQQRRSPLLASAPCIYGTTREVERTSTNTHAQTQTHTHLGEDTGKALIVELGEHAQPHQLRSARHHPPSEVRLQASQPRDIGLGAEERRNVGVHLLRGNGES